MSVSTTGDPATRAVSAGDWPSLLVGDVAALHAAHPALGHRTAVSCEDAALTWVELDTRATRLGRGLGELGIGSGDAVAIYLHNCLEYMECIFGLAKSGIVAVPLSPRWVASEVEYALRSCEAAAVLTDAAGLDAARAAARESGMRAERVIVVSADAKPRSGRSASPVAPTPYEDVLAVGERSRADLARPAESDPFRLAFTSGTTGPPKVCVVRHRAAVQTWAEMSVAFEMTARDCELVIGSASPARFSSSMWGERSGFSSASTRTAPLRRSRRTGRP
jgi:acyl-CoA synthetase (AMP-forming)/AMP-acid ligase II